MTMGQQIKILKGDKVGKKERTTGYWLERLLLESQLVGVLEG